MGINEILQGGVLSEDEKKDLLNLPANLKDEILALLKNDQDRRNREMNLKPELIGNKENILKDLENNHLTIEKDKEMMWDRDIDYKSIGNIFHLELPAVGGFNGYKCDFFVKCRDDNYSTISKTVFEGEDANLKNIFKMYSVSYTKIVELLKAMNEYMKEYGVLMDENIDFENDLLLRCENSKNKCETGNCLKRLFHLYGQRRQFLLRETDINGSGEYSRVYLDCSDDNFCFRINYI